MVVRKNGVDVVGHSFEHVLLEFPSRTPVGLLHELGHSELTGAVPLVTSLCDALPAVNADKEIQLSFSGLHFGDVDMKEPDQVAFELLTLWFASFDIGQARYAVPLEASVPR